MYAFIKKKMMKSETKYDLAKRAFQCAQNATRIYCDSEEARIKSLNNFTRTETEKLQAIIDKAKYIKDNAKDLEKMILEL